MVCFVASFEDRFDIYFGIVNLMYYDMQIILGSVKVAEWPPFWKQLLSKLTICSLCIMSSCCFISHFCFKDRIVVMIVSIPGHCLLLILVNNNCLTV